MANPNLTQIRFYIRRQLGDLRGYDVYATLDGRAVRYTTLVKNARVGDHVSVEAYGGWDSRSMNETITAENVLREWRHGAAERQYRKERRERSSRIRDFQRQKVYSWETVAWEKTQTRSVGGVEECQALVSNIFDTYGLIEKTPTVEIKRALKRTSYYQKHGNRIALAARWGTRRSTVIHEAVHGLIDQGHGERVAAHGPEFVSLLAECYDLFLGDERPDGMDYDRSLALAAERGVKFERGFTLRA